MVKTVLMTIALALTAGVAAAADPKWEACTKGSGQSAIDACTALIDGGNSAAAYLNRGATYFNMKDYKKAEADLTEAIKVNPEGPRAWKTRGKARMWLRDYSHALADFDKALGLPLMNTDDFKEQRDDAELWRMMAESAVSATGSKPERTAEPVQVLNCAGPFARDSSHAKLGRAFGTENVTFEEQSDAEGGNAGKATVVFPKEPKRRLVVFWSDAKERRQTASIKIVGQSTWSTPNGLKVGSSMAEVETLNGKPFTIGGFGVDYGGTGDFSGGLLAQALPGECFVSVNFMPGDEQAASKVSAEKTFASADPRMRAAKPVVSEIYLAYRKP
jgi:hypothetical protein